VRICFSYWQHWWLMCTFSEVGALLPIYVISSLQKFYVVVCRFWCMERLALSDLCCMVVSVVLSTTLTTIPHRYLISTKWDGFRKLLTIITNFCIGLLSLLCRRQITSAITDLHPQLHITSKGANSQ
jgi:hypothetical protein